MDETFFNALLELNEIIARRSFMQRTQFLQEHSVEQPDDEPFSFAAQQKCITQ